MAAWRLSASPSPAGPGAVICGPAGMIALEPMLTAVSPPRRCSNPLYDENTAAAAAAAPADGTGGYMDINPEVVEDGDDF